MLPTEQLLYRTRKRRSEEYMEKLNRRILERLKPAKKVGTDATGMRQSKRDCAWSSASLGLQKEYIKIHGLFNLETGTVEAFEATKGTEHECKHLPDLLTPLDYIECFVADQGPPFPKKLLANRRKRRCTIHKTEKEQPNEG